MEGQIHPWSEGSESVVPAQQHDDAALDDVEPGPVLLEAPAQASSAPPAPHKLHLCFNTHPLSLSLSLCGVEIVGSERSVAKECC